MVKKGSLQKLIIIMGTVCIQYSYLVYITAVYTRSLCSALICDKYVTYLLVIMHTKTPTAPEEFIGTIQNISDNATIALTGAKAISFINWSMPENVDKTAIDYFEITLMGTRTNNTMSVRMADQYSLQALSQKYVLSEGNYTSVSITAVDLCGKRSERIQVHLTNATTVGVSNIATSVTQQRNVTCTATGTVLGVLLLISLVIAAALIVAVILLAIRVRRHQDVSSSAEFKTGEDEVKLTP